MCLLPSCIRGEPSNQGTTHDRDSLQTIWVDYMSFQPLKLIAGTPETQTIVSYRSLNNKKSVLGVILAELYRDHKGRLLVIIPSPIVGFTGCSLSPKVSGTTGASGVLAWVPERLRSPRSRAQTHDTTPV